MKRILIRFVVIFLVLAVSFYPSVESNASNPSDPGDPPTLPEWAHGTRAAAILTEIGGNRKFDL